MSGEIKKAGGKINYYQGTNSKFNSLEELIEIVSKESDNMPEYVIIVGESDSGKKYQLCLEYNMFSETNIDINSLRSSKFQRFLGDILMKKGIITQENLNEALTQQKQSLYNERIGEILIRLGFITYDQIIAALSDQMGTAKK
ncbi:MAG: hypothetical protein ABII23_01015 [bacterium]